jgi:PhnB protein
MMRLDPYLNFNGKTEEAFLFYKSVFGGKFTTFIRFSEMPGSEKMSEDDRNKMMHVALPIGDNNVLMATDVLDSMNQQLKTGDNFSISISLDSEADTKRIFEGLSEGGQVLVPLKKEPWSELFGLCKDKFGVQWMFNYYKK